MRKKKICRYHHFNMSDCQWLVNHSKCPRNTNSKCEIIPAKPKMKRVKGWIHMFEGAVLGYLTHNLDGKCPPCTIIAEAKYFRRKA